jgi:hypothetical protein
LILGNPARRSKLADAGIGKNDVELAFLLLDGRVQLVDVRRLGDIA